MAKNVDKNPEEIREVFDLFDYKGDSKIPVSDIVEVIRALGLNPTNKEIGKFDLFNSSYWCLLDESVVLVSNTVKLDVRF